jgi:two-component system cell cycle response regulator
MVEPSDKDYRKLRACLKGHKEIRIIRTRTIRSALAFLTRHAFDLVCLDYFLPDGTGHDFLTRLNESGMDLPVVIITGHSDPMAAARIIQAGAYDFLPKQKLSQSPLFRVIVNALEKARFQKEIKEAQRKIVEMSILDDLTGLCNRRCFTDLLEKESARALRYGTPLVLCMMDVDEFKRVNDLYGHQAGDMVLRELGSLLRKSIRMSDTACRYGGEEFALLLPNTDLREAMIQGERLRRMFETHRFEWKGTPFRVTLSFGLTRLNSGTNPSSTSLVEDADKALYKAKRAGKNRVVANEGDQPA